MQDQKPGPIIGQKGVKYGLQRPVSKAVPTKPAAPKTLNIFGDDDSEEDDVAAQIARQSEKKRRDAKAAQLQAEALAQDPSVFAYDEVYDDIQTAREQPRQQEKQVRKPKYIEMLLQQAQDRKKEQDISFERRQVKERQKEDYMFEGKEKFVTAAYRKKLEEDKKWHEAERLRELEEEKQDVRKVGHMGNFYKNLLTGNVAFGTATERGAAKTSSSREGDEQEPSQNTDEKVLEKAKKMEEDLDDYDRMRLEAERAFREAKKGQTQRQQEPEDKELEQEDGPGPSGEDSRAGQENQDERRERKNVPSSSSNQPAAAEARPAGDPVGEEQPGHTALTGGRRKADEAAVSAARERYLARKKAKIGG